MNSALSALAPLGGAFGKLGTRALQEADVTGPFELPITRLSEPSYWSALMNYPPVKALLPIPLLLALAPAVWWFFHKTWEEVDQESFDGRVARGPGVDYRPAACFLITAVVLTIQEY